MLDGSDNRTKRRHLSNNEIMKRWLSDYGGQKIIGDACPYYSSQPEVGIEAPLNIHKSNPDTKIIYIVRNPYERIISNYLHDMTVYERSNVSTVDFDLNRHVMTRRHLISRSLYYKQLQPYLELFPEKNIKMILMEEMSMNPKHVLREISEFLGISTDFEFDTSRVHNATSDRISWWLTGAANEKVGDQFFSMPVFEKLQREVVPDVQSLQDFMGKSLDLWNLSSSKWCR